MPKEPNTMPGCMPLASVEGSAVGVESLGRPAELSTGTGGRVESIGSAAESTGVAIESPTAGTEGVGSAEGLMPSLAPHATTTVRSAPDRAARNQGHLPELS